MAKPSLQAALLNDTSAKTPKPAAVADVAAASAEPSRATKKLIVEIPAEAHYQIDKMRLELRRDSIKGLVVEALNDLFKKHGYPPIA